MSAKLISIVIPCYNEESNIRPIYEAVTKVLETVTYDREIIFVDNGSQDRSAKEMGALVERDSKVKALLLSRNFGPESSGLAGLQHARGDAVIVVAADLQDPPELIPEFVKKWEEGYDIVLGQMISSNEGRVMRRIRRAFYGILKNTAYIDIPSSVTGFGLIDRRVNQVINDMPERSRFYRGLVAWAGFRRCLIPYKRRERKFGRSSYNLLSYLRHAEMGLFSFTTVPLELLTYLGLLLVVLSGVAIATYVSLFLLFGNPIKGSATLFLGIMFFGGIQVLAISIVGKYIAIICDETKQRPHYIIKEVVSRDP
ncbi:MAG: glycosyltransferase family 2 protein [Acidobacteria bacterium]|nr:glycosyltransferase family 2 protein [Acidobacteriota bacterium]